jgi:hypothetical protein
MYSTSSASKLYIRGLLHLLCSRALDETERAAKHIAQCAVVLHPPRNVALILSR